MKRNNRSKCPMHRKFLGGLLVLSSLVLAGCAGNEPATDRLQILVTFYPLQFVAERIAGEHADVTNITPAAADPHNLELAPMHVKAMGDADFIVHLSGGFQPAIDQGLEVIGDVPTADTAVYATDREGDPHFWLDPLRLAEAGELVAQELSKIDPDQSALYRTRAQELSQELQELDAEISQELEPCQGATLVTAHEAFGFFADRYGLEQVGITGINPEQEPSPARLRAVAKVVAEQDVQTLFFELAASDKMTQVLATEVGVDVAVLHPMERTTAGDYYPDIMRQNLVALKAGLNCG